MNFNTPFYPSSQVKSGSAARPARVKSHAFRIESRKALCDYIGIREFSNAECPLQQSRAVVVFPVPLGPAIISGGELSRNSSIVNGWLNLSHLFNLSTWKRVPIFYPIMQKLHGERYLYASMCLHKLSLPFYLTCKFQVFQPDTIWLARAQNLLISANY